jgi:peptidoglycan hydrolase-like protein with peptidoglycan-binding domain
MIRIGSRGDTIRSVQRLLTELGYIALIEDRTDLASPRLRAEQLDIDGVYGPQTQLAIMDFQRDEGIFVDGEIGPQTMSALDAAYTRRMLEINSPGPDALRSFNADGRPITGVAAGAAAERLPFVRIETGLPSGPLTGLAAFQLRADIAEEFEGARAKAKSFGVTLAISAGKRALDAPVSIGHSPTSMHYVGRAFDLHVYSGMVEPDTDRYVVEMPEEGRHMLEWIETCHGLTSDDARKLIGDRPDDWCWRVWARCPEGTEGPEVVSEIKNVATYLDPCARRPRAVKGPFINLTGLLGEFGFTPLPPHPRFFDFRSEPVYAEWWHFQCERGLFRNVSTFGGDLSRSYSEGTLAGTPPWGNRHKVFGADWV